MIGDIRHLAGVFDAECGASGGRTAAFDEPFTCPVCWRSVAGPGVEPMGSRFPADPPWGVEAPPAVGVLAGPHVWVWDCSNHDWLRGAMDFAAAKRDGISVVVHKATDGVRYYADPYFAEATRRAQAARLVRGAYHVLWPGDVNAQVDWFLSTIDATCPGWRAGPFALALDCEPFGYNGGAPGLSDVRAAAARVRSATGHTPLVYGPRWVYGDRLTGVGCPLWASGYGANPAVHYPDGYPGDQAGIWSAYSGQTPALVQYGSQLKVGTQPTCDVSCYRGTLDQLIALTGGGDMLTQQDITAVAQAVWAYPAVSGNGTDTGQARAAAIALTDLYLLLRWGRTVGDTDPHKAGLVAGALVDIHAAVSRPPLDPAAVGQATAQAVLAGLTPAVIADAVVAALPPDLAGQVVDGIGARLAAKS